MADEFDLEAARLVWIPVTFTVLESTGDALGQPSEKTVELKVDLIDLDEFSRLFVSPVETVTVTPAVTDDGGKVIVPAVTEVRPRANAKPEATPERIAEWNDIDDTVRALAITRDWRRVKSNGRDVPYSPEAMAKLMRVQGFAQALFLHAYPTAYAGLADTRLGNSESSPAPGPVSDAAPQ